VLFDSVDVTCIMIRMAPHLRPIDYTVITEFVKFESKTPVTREWGDVASGNACVVHVTDARGC